MKFTKLQAHGNDFLVLALDEVADRADLSTLARRMCDRHFGAGADGLVVAWPVGGPEADWASRIFNADGGEAEVSGNGTRCLAAWLDANGAWAEERDVLRIATAAGTKTLRRAGAAGGIPRYEADMGRPRFASAEVPMLLDPPTERVVDVRLDTEGIAVDVTALSIGNPHCTVFVDDLASVDVRGLGTALERHEAFPERTNVEFAQVLAWNRLRVLFWERGVGETLSSGTGSCAAAVAASVTGRCGRDVEVETLAGPVGVAWSETDDRVRLSGSAELLYEATWRARV